MALVDTDRSVNTFRQLSVDDQLALLWLIYTEMGEAVTPAAPGSAELQITETLLQQIKAMSHDEQLNFMRDLASNRETELTRDYGAWSINTQLGFWYRLAQGMEDGSIVMMPSDYQMSDQACQLLDQIRELDFGQQITILRQTVGMMGIDPLV